MEMREQQEAIWTSQLEAAGESQVRLVLSGDGYPQTMRLFVIKWLARKEQERAEVEEAVQKQRAADERYAKTRDDIAAVAAVIAAIAAIVGAFISWAAWIHPRAPT